MGAVVKDNESVAVAAVRSPSATVFRGAFALLSTQPLTWAVTLLITVLVPKYLGANGLGQSAFLVTLAGLAGSVVSLGLPLYLVRRIAVAPERARVEGGAALVLCTGVALIVAVGLSLGLPLVGVSATDGVLLEIVLAGMVVATAQATIFSTLNGQGRHGRFAWLNLGNVVVSSVAGLVVLARGGDLAGYLGTTVVVTGVVTVLGWRMSGMRLERAAFSPKLWVELTRSSLPFLGSNLTLQIRSQIVFVVTGLLLPAQAVGWFAAAYRIIAIPVFIPTAVITPLLPVLSRNVDRPEEFKKTLRNSLTTVLLLTVPVSGMILVLAPAIPDLFHWGAAFYPSVVLMRVLAFQQPLVAVDMVLGTALIALHKERQLLRVSIAGAIFNPVMSLALIPIFQEHFDNGIVVAAVIELATECLFLGWSMVLLPRGLVDRAAGGSTLRVVLAGMGMVGVATVLNAMSVPLAVAMAGGCLSYAGLVIGLRVVRVDDLLSIRRLALAARGAH